MVKCNDLLFFWFVQVRDLLSETMQKLVLKVTGDKIQTQRLLSDRLELTQHQCYKTAVQHYKSRCFNWHTTEVMPTETLV